MDKFSPDGSISHPSQILTVGRLVEKKGHSTSLEAIRDLYEQGYDIEFNIIGDGPLFEDLVNKSNDLGIQNCVSFKSKVSDRELLSAYDRAGIFLQPCRRLDSGNRDGIPTTLKEAMAMENVPITTRIAGVPELVTDSRNGFLLPENSPSVVADKIGHLIENPGLWQEMSKEARTSAMEKSSISTTVDELVTVFNSIVYD